MLPFSVPVPHLLLQTLDVEAHVVLLLAFRYSLNFIGINNFVNFYSHF